MDNHFEKICDQEKVSGTTLGNDIVEILISYLARLEHLMLKKVVLNLLATALASIVLPVPAHLMVSDPVPNLPDPDSSRQTDRIQMLHLKNQNPDLTSQLPS